MGQNNVCARIFELRNANQNDFGSVLFTTEFIGGEDFDRVFNELQ